MQQHKPKRKELQSKLNIFISDFTGTLTKVDSKKLKKSIKKASKLIARAIVKSYDESEVEVSLKEKPARSASKIKTAAKVKKAAVKKSTAVKRFRKATKKRIPDNSAPKPNGVSNKATEPQPVKKEITA